MGRYAEEFHRSLADPEGFWGDAARDIDWYQAPTVVLDRSSTTVGAWYQSMSVAASPQKPSGSARLRWNCSA